MIDYIKLQKEFDSLPDDTAKWEWMRQNKDKGIVIVLDNDDTYGVIEDAYDDPNSEENPFVDVIFDFDDYLGSGSGIYNLLESIGIKSRPC